ncbi:MAG: DUF3237 domain-containing protein [Acetobacteraceae bacterium]|nr:DUF3237 domain-containing protein [Acetobacteraceae bacterium]
MDAIKSEFLFEVRIEVAAPVPTGATPGGERRVVAILGGSFEGPRLRGSVLPGGSDAIWAQPSGRTLLDVRLVLKTHDGAAIYLQYRGVRNGPEAVMKRLAAGESVDPAEYYFRTAILFETGDPRYDWLNDTVAIGVGNRLPTGPVYRVFAVL